MINNEMLDLQNTIDQHRSRILQQIESIERNNSQQIEDFKNRLQNELKYLQAKKIALDVLVSSRDQIRLLNTGKDFLDYVNQRNRALYRLQIPNIHNYHIEGIDQFPVIKRYILECGRVIENLRQLDQEITLHNPELEKLIADQQTFEEWNFGGYILIDHDMKIVANALQNNTVGKFYIPILSFISSIYLAT